MLSLSPVKLLIVLVVAMILLGPDKLPQVAKQMGAGWRAIRDFQQKMEHEVRSSIPDLPSTEHLAKMARSPISFLNSLADMPADDLEPAVPDPGATEEVASDDAPWPVDRTALSFEDDLAPGPIAGSTGNGTGNGTGTTGTTGTGSNGDTGDAPENRHSVSAGGTEPLAVPHDPSMN